MKAALILTLALFTAACSMDINLHMGHRPDPAGLEQRLRIGESSTVDVVAVLGPPDAKGEVMLPLQQRPMVMWLYSYEEIATRLILPVTNTHDPRSLVMFVFFDGDTYQGSLWASSLPEAPKGPTQ